MKCCVSTHVGTWTNWLNFEPDLDYSPDAGTGLLSPLSYKRWYAEFYVGKIRHIRIGHCNDAWFYNGFINWASEPSKHLCWRYMLSTECPSSLFLILYSDFTANKYDDDDDDMYRAVRSCSLQSHCRRGLRLQSLSLTLGRALQSLALQAALLRGHGPRYPPQCTSAVWDNSVLRGSMKTWLEANRRSVILLC